MGQDRCATEQTANQALCMVFSIIFAQRNRRNCRGWRNPIAAVSVVVARVAFADGLNMLSSKRDYAALCTYFDTK
jgi:hypothetical protein